MSPSFMAFIQEVDHIQKEAVGLPKFVLQGLGKLKGVAKGWSRVKPTAQGYSGDLVEAASRVKNPLAGIRKGWMASSPRTALEQGVISPKDAERLLKRSPWMAEKARPLVEIARSTPGYGGKAREVARELSRRGWTGEGNVTKYLPVGSKGLAATFAAPVVGDVARSQKATPTGEGGAVENLLGGVGMTLGGIASTRLGVLPGLGMFTLGSQGGKGLGRVIDRFRAGASPSQALFAPSPQEAAEQLQNIGRYYG
jgi:hypothetical protein